MAGKGPKDDAYDVSDSTDWLQTPLAALTPVEAALRCQVCKDFYTTPMITSCMHTFCSLCIRRCLNNDGKCPACRASDQELKLRNVWTLEDAVESFKKARDGLLDYARRPVIDPGWASPKRKLKDLYDGDEDYARKRTRSSSRRAGPSKEQTIVVDSEDGDEDYVPEDGLVACPICNGRMTEKAVGEHIDQCTGTPPTTSSRTSKKFNSSSLSKSSSLSSITVSRPERLPHLNYSMFRDTALKKKLGDLGISSHGTRQLMEKRHTEWVTLWNANCDSKNPRKKSELKRELDIWERTQGAPLSSSSLNPGSQLLSKDFDGAAWASNHEDSFKQLIANAKKKPPVMASLSPSTQSPADISMEEGTLREGLGTGNIDISGTRAGVLSGTNIQKAGEGPPPIIVNGTTPGTEAISQNRRGRSALEDRKDLVMDSDLTAVKPLQP